jgi:PKD repeat protein
MKIGKLLIISIVVSGLFALLPQSTVAIDESEVITDPANDVYTFEGFDMSSTGGTDYVTEHEDIDVKNIDIREVRYNRQDKSVVLRLKVEGEIEDRGQLFDINSMDDITLEVNNVAYEIAIQTTDNDQYYDYAVTYTNQTCQVTNPDFNIVNLSDDDFYIENKDTLVITFELDTADEVYENMRVTATFMKFNLLDLETIPEDEDFDDLFVFLTDVAPNPPVEAIAIVTNLGEVGKPIDFNGSQIFGQPPYTYKWEFGDGSTSTEKSPTHTYTKAGTYEYTFTVTDNSGDSNSYSYTIEISGSNGHEDGPPIVMFIGVIVIIAIIGIVAVGYIIRR